MRFPPSHWMTFAHLAYLTSFSHGVGARSLPLLQVQYPDALPTMALDLTNIRVMAAFLSKVNAVNAAVLKRQGAGCFLGAGKAGAGLTGAAAAWLVGWVKGASWPLIVKCALLLWWRRFCRHCCVGGWHACVSVQGALLRVVVGCCGDVSLCYALRL